MVSTDIAEIKQALGMDKVKPLHYPLDTIGDVLDIGDQYTRPDTKFMCYFMYLSGQRVSEFLETRRRDITIQDKDNKTWVIVDTMTEKNRQYPRRIIPIAEISGIEKPMADYVIKYIEGIDPSERLVQDSRTNIWNKISLAVAKVRALMVDNKTYQDIMINVYPHYLRHCRAAHLVKYRNYDIYKLMAYFGWRNVKTPTIYAKLSWQTLTF